LDIRQHKVLAKINLPYLIGTQKGFKIRGRYCLTTLMKTIQTKIKTITQSISLMSALRSSYYWNLSIHLPVNFQTTHSNAVRIHMWYWITQQLLRSTWTWRLSLCLT